MQLTIDKKAQAWFEEEMGVSKERGVRFLGKVYLEHQLQQLKRTLCEC